MAKITLEDLLDIEPVKVSKDARSASLMILGESKVGKSTFINELYGDRILFIATERRHNFLAGAKVIDISSYAEYLRVMKLIRDPKIQEQYDAVVVDTFTRLQEWAEEYTLSRLNIEDLGDLGFGKGHSEFKKEMAKAVELIETSGLVPHFIVHTKTQVKQVPKNEISDDQVNDSMTLTKDKKTGQQVYEYNKEVADLKNSTFNALNRVCDNILFFDVILDDNGKEQRRIWYRDSLFHIAGSSLKHMPEYTELSAQAYLDAFEKAVEQEGKENTTDKPKEKPTDESGRYNFDSLMSEIADLGKQLQLDGKAEERNKVIEEVLGKGNKVKDTKPEQAEVLAVLVDKLKEIA